LGAKSAREKRAPQLIVSQQSSASLAALACIWLLGEALPRRLLA
jgi:hypothetical protein